MAEYINRQTLIERIIGTGYCDQIMDNLLFIANMIPAADVVERKKGKWMPSSLTWSYYNYDCSVCGCNEFRQVDHNGGYKAFNFCPNCGADMREPPKEECMDKLKNHDKAVKKAYNLLVAYRRSVEDKYPDYAEEIEEAYKQLWCECLNEQHPW